MNSRPCFNDRSMSDALNQLYLRHGHFVRLGLFALLLALAACQPDGGGNGY